MRNLGKKYCRLSVSHKSLYIFSNLINEIILYKIQTSATEIEFDMNNLVKYRAGAVRYEKKYNQNHFLIIFCCKGSSLRMFSWYI